MLLDRVTNKWLDKDNFAKQSTWTSTKTSSSSTDIKYSTKTSSSTSTNLPVSASTSAYTECLNKYILQPFLQVSPSRHAIPMLPPLRLTPPQCLQQRCSRPTTTPAARCLHNAPTHTPLAPKIVATQPSRLYMQPSRFLHRPQQRCLPHRPHTAATPLHTVPKPSPPLQHTLHIPHRPKTTATPPPRHPQPTARSPHATPTSPRAGPTPPQCRLSAASHAVVRCPCIARRGGRWVGKKI